MLHVSHSPGSAVASIHDRCIHFVGAGAGKDRAFAGIKARIVFQHPHGCFSSIERQPATLQDLIARMQRILNSGAIFLFALRSHLGALDRAGTPVDNQCNVIHGSLIGIGLQRRKRQSKTADEWPSQPCEK